MVDYYDPQEAEDQRIESGYPPSAPPQAIGAGTTVVEPTPLYQPAPQPAPIMPPPFPAARVEPATPSAAPPAPSEDTRFSGKPPVAPPEAQSFDSRFSGTHLPTVVDMEPVPPPPPMGYGAELGRGMVRSAGGTVLDLAGAAATGLDKVADWTGSEWLKHYVAEDREDQKRNREKLEKDYGPSVATVAEAIQDPSKFAHYMTGKAGEAIPWLAGYATAGIKAMALASGLVGAQQAAQANNGDYGATATGATIGLAAGLAPVPFMHGAAGRTLINNLTRSVLGMELIGVGQTLAEPLPKAAAGGGYTPPTGEQFAEAALGTLPGAAGVGVMGWRGGRAQARQQAEADAAKAAADAAATTQTKEDFGGYTPATTQPDTDATTPIPGARPTHIIGYDENGAPIADPNIPVTDPLKYGQGPPGALAESTTGSHLNDPAVGAAVDAAVNTPPASAADAAARQIMQGADPRQVLAEQTRQGMGPSPVAGGPAMGLADPTVAAARAGPPPPAAPPPGFTAPIDRAAIERGATIAQARAQAEEGAPPPTPPAEAPGIPRAPGAGRGVPVEEPPITGYQPGRTGIAPEPPPSGRPVPLAQQTDVSPGWRMGPDGKLYRAETPNLENVSGWQRDANGNLQRVENAPTSEPTAGPLFERTAQPIAPQVGDPTAGRMTRSTGEIVPRYPLGPEGQGTLPITTPQTPIRMSRREPLGAGTTTPERPPGYLPEALGGRVRVEPDHEEPRQSVGKDETGRVLSVGETPEVARRLAEERLAREAAAPTEAAAAPPAAAPVKLNIFGLPEGQFPGPVERVTAGDLKTGDWIKVGKKNLRVVKASTNEDGSVRLTIDSGMGVQTDNFPASQTVRRMTPTTEATRAAPREVKGTAGTTVVEPTPSPAPAAKTGGAGREGTTRPATDVGVKETAPGKFRVTVDGKETGSTYMSREKADAVATRAGSLASDTKLTGPALVAKAASIVRGTAKLAESYRKTTAETAARVAKEGTPPVAEPAKPTPVVGLIKRPDRFESTKPGEAATKGRTLSPEERAKVAAEYKAAEDAKQLASRRTADAIAAREAARRGEIAGEFRAAGDVPIEVERGAVDVGERVTKEAVEEAVPTETKETKVVSRGGKDSTLLYERGAASTTDQRIHGSRLLQDVLEGHIDPKTGEPITAAGASERYGSQAPGAGQRRRENRFVDYLNHRIEMAEDPKHLDALILRAKDLEGRKQTAVVKKQFAEVTRDYNRLAVERDRLEDVKAIRDELASTKPKTGWGSGETLAQRIARRKAERDGGVAGMAPDVIEFPDAAQRAAEHRTGVQYGLHLEAVNAPLEARIRAMHANKETHNLGDFLDDIIDNPSAKIFAPQFVKLAEIYKGLIETRDIPVKTFVNEIAPGLRGGAYYDSHEDSIGIRTREHANYGRTQVLMHEATHVVSLKYLSEIGRRLVHGGYVTPHEERVYRSMDALGDELQRVLQYGRNIIQVERSSGEYAYQSKNNIELITEGISNPYLQSLMARTKASPQLIRELRKQGMLPDNVRPTMWDAFKDTMRQMFGLKPGERSVLELALRPLTETIEVGAAYRGGRGPGRVAVGEIAGAPPELPARITDALPTPEMREQARPIGDVVRALPGGEKLGKVLDGLTTSVTGADLNRIFNSGVLVGSPTHIIAESNKHLIPQLPGIVNTQGKRQRVFTDTLEKWGDHVQGLINRVNAASPALMGDAQRNSLINRASLAQAFISKENMTVEQANPHLKGDKLEVARGLKQEFDALPQNEKDLYRDVIKFHQSTGWDERQASFNAAIDMAMGRDFIPARETPQSYQDKWDAMSHPERAAATPEGQDVNVRNFYVNSLNEARAELGRIGRSKPKIDEILGRGADNSPLAMLLADNWQHSRPMVQALTRLQRRGWMEGDFAPQRRHGDWFVKWGDEAIPDGEPGAYGLKMFERSSEAQAWRDDFARDNPSLDVSQVNLKSTTGSGVPREVLPQRIFDQFDSELSKRGMSPGSPEYANAHDALVGIFMQAATQGQAARFSPKRQGIEGSSNDHARILQDELLIHSARMGFYTHAAEENRLYADAEKHLEQLRQGRRPSTLTEIAESARLLAEAEKAFKQGDPAYTQAEIDDLRQQHAWRVKPPTGIEQNTAVQVFDEFKRRRAPVDGDSSTKITGKAARGFTQGSFIYHLMRPAHLAYSLIEAHMNAQALLGGEFGHGATAAALGRAVAAVGPKGLAQGVRNMFAAAHGAMKQSDWHLSKLMEKRLVESGMNPEHAGRLMEAANNLGLIDYSTVREVQRMAGKGAFGFGGAKTDFFHNMMNLFAAGEHAIDAMNRTAILKAGFDLAMRRNGGDVAGAIDKAIYHATRAMPVNALWNKPRIATERGPFASPLVAATMQYKLYGLHLYSVMGSLVKQAITRPEERAVAIKSLVSLFAIHSLMVGALANMFGVPVNLATGVYDFFTDKPGPHNYETDGRRALTDLFGPEASTFLSRGLMGLAGADAHMTFKLTNMLDIPGPRTFDKAGVVEMVGGSILGASGQLGAQLVDGLKQMVNGNYQKGLTELLPRTIGDVIKAVQSKNEGQLDPRGRVIAPPVSWLGAAEQALGFRPMEIVDPQDRHSAIMEREREISAARRVALDRYVNNKDTSAILAYNKTASQDRLPLITSQNMHEAQQRQRQRLRDPTLYGVSVPRNELVAARAAANF